jgi:hypothetical protein
MPHWYAYVPFPWLDFGYYTPTAGASCTSCADVEGLICSGGLANVAAGYWAFLVTSPSGMALYETSPCPAGFCPGSSLQTVSANTSIIPPPVYCSYPRLNSPSNILCGECEDGYKPWGSQCRKCDGVDGPLVFGALMLSLAIVILMLRSGGAAAGPIAVFLYFTQTAALEVGYVSQSLTWLRIFNLGASSSTACLAPFTPYQQILLSLLTPLILLIELIFICAVHFCDRLAIGVRE